MELTNLPMFGLLRNRMNWLGQRQEVLAQNVANADTPNYSSRDLKAFDFRQVLNESRRSQSGVVLQSTNAAHIHDGSAGGRGDFVSGEVKALEAQTAQLFADNLNDVDDDDMRRKSKELNEKMDVVKAELDIRAQVEV